VIIKGVRPEHLPLLSNVGVIESLRHENHLVDTLEEAIAHARHHVAEQRSSPPQGRLSLGGAHQVSASTATS
jgi:hypothetical protein